ncbi:hypothetical protein BDZ45DRAFT_753492 [Acephala macrosclerotiorum]|nr:hypothetical protein BDZ45DRAFT_753492 [Acephala macrosclerotiorum]
MATDMDIEMDIDIGLTEEDLMIPEVETIPDSDVVQTGQQDPTPILTHPNDASGPDSLEPTPEKVHLRGLDNLTTKDIQAFASEYYKGHSPLHVEWIDDTSANLVYENAEIAWEALLAFVSMEVADGTQIPALQTLPAKSFPAHPDTNLQVRLAVVGDRKQAGARERSRFYLFNPEYDPAERRKRGSVYRGGARKYRDREDGGYRSQRYDDREQRKRELESDFDATLYDDDKDAIAKRADRRHTRQDSSSGGDSGDRGQRHVRFHRDRELFPERDHRSSGRLRDRSASPARETDVDRDAARMRRQDAAARENRQKAQSIKARLREAQNTKELFPQKTSISHRRSGAFDAADETADLFANRMPVPFTDGSSDSRPKKGVSLASRITRRDSDNDIGFSIRGAAKALPVQGFSIKGAASGGARVKELFPSTFGDNAGKELFSEALEGRGRRRQKAEDLFY